MPRAYFIGGAPRVGKSSLAKRFLEAHPMPSAATDDLRTNLRRITPASVKPELYYLDGLNSNEADMARLMREHTADIIKAADRESSVVWRAVEGFVRGYLATGHDVLIEGVAVLPHLVAELEFDYSAVYLGNQSPDHAQIIQNYAQNHPDSWLGSLQPDTIAAFAKFTLETSIHIEKEAQLFSQPYLEMSDSGFDNVLKLAQHALNFTP